MSSKFTVVKYAADPYWTYHFSIDPKKTGVIEDFSAHDSYTGKQAELKVRYNSIEEAELGAAKANELNPSCGYAVCKLVRH